MTGEMTKTIPARGERVMSVEFWRFLFTVLVSVYHLEIFFFSGEKLFTSGTSAVEFFFILAGFTLAMSAKRRAGALETPVTPKEAHGLARDYVKKKLKAIYPLLAVSLILGLIVYPLILTHQNSMWYLNAEDGILKTLMNSEWEWLLLVGTPFGFNEGASTAIPLWFLTALLVVGYAYTYAINRHYHFVRFAAPVIGILGYIFFTLNSNLLMDHVIQMGMFNAGTFHAIAEMSLGIFLFQIYEVLSQKRLNVFWRILLTVGELYAIYRLFALTFYQPVGFDNFRKVVYLMIIILFSFLNRTYFTRLLNNRVSRWLGGISLAMYLCHYQLIPIYMQTIANLKLKLSILRLSSPVAKWLYPFVLDMGGTSGGYRAVAMSWKDMTAYLLLVIAVSLLAMLLVAGIGRGYRAVRARLDTGTAEAAEVGTEDAPKESVSERP